MTPRAINLRCEQMVNPLGLDEPSPRLSWRMADSRPGASVTGSSHPALSGGSISMSPVTNRLSRSSELGKTTLSESSSLRLKMVTRQSLVAVSAMVMGSLWR